MQGARDGDGEGPRKPPLANSRTRGSLTGVAKKSKSASSLAIGRPGDGHPALDRARLLLGDLGLQQLADDLLRRVAALEPVGDDIVEGGGHARQLERAHHLQDLMTRRGRPPSSGRNGGNRPPADDEDANSPGLGWTPGAQVGGTGRGC